jgi:hAT family C-terminal dimerisation region
LGAVVAEDEDSKTPMSSLTESKDEILSTTSPIQDQMLNFYKKIASYKGNPIQPLEFFSSSRVALVVLAITPSSAEVERLFSKSGLVVTKKRTNLSSAHIYKLVTLDCWLSRGEEILNNISDAQSGNINVRKDHNNRCEYRA